MDMEAFFSILQTVPKLPDGKQLLVGPSAAPRGLQGGAQEGAADSSSAWHDGERRQGQASAPVGAVGTSGRGVHLELKVPQLTFSSPRVVCHLISCICVLLP